jgi:hypothetical protein
MKKIYVLSIAALGFVGLSTASASNIVSQLNAEIAALLAPLTDADTQASLSFSDIRVDAEKALFVSGSAAIHQTGARTSLGVTIDEAAYDFGDGTAPNLVVTGSLSTDLRKILPQEEINSLVPSLKDAIEDLAKSYLAEFGEAASVKAEITGLEQDQDLNYVAGQGRVSVSIDLDRLPAGMAKEAVPATSIDVFVNLNVATGSSFSLKVIMNPAFEEFADESEGLKDYLDKLLARDAETLESLRSGFEQLILYAETIVN